MEADFLVKPESEDDGSQQSLISTAMRLVYIWCREMGHGTLHLQTTLLNINLTAHKAFTEMRSLKIFSFENNVSMCFDFLN